jgi:Cu/Ag efflux protein CusF
MLNPRIIGRGLLVASLLLVWPVGTEAASTKDAKKKEAPKMRQIKEPTDVYTGKIDKIDEAARTIVVKGKILQREFEIPEGRKYTAPHQSLGAKKLGRGTSGTFKVSPSCKISTAGKTVAFLKDLKAGDMVDVTFREVSTGDLLADIIAPAPPRGDTKPK